MHTGEFTVDKEWTNLSTEEMLQLTKGRSAWRCLVYRVADVRVSDEATTTTTTKPEPGAAPPPPLPLNENSG